MEHGAGRDRLIRHRHPDERIAGLGWVYIERGQGRVSDGPDWGFSSLRKLMRLEPDKDRSKKC